MVDALAAGGRHGEQPTGAPHAERLAADRATARHLMGAEVSDEEFDEAADMLGNIYRIAAASRVGSAS